ncbi:tyrosinase, partial [Aspergillus affinis]|uniref:tyrosinase n=1 Tax=Aspergillus affinis TaxID=1070780 RepID=UPI0022FEA6D5
LADRETILKRLNELYGSPVRDQYAHIPDPNNKTDDEKERDDYVITLVYDRYALGGSPYTINVFLGEVSVGSYGGPGSQGFVGSIYNFSGSLKNCPKCKKQAEEGVKSIAQVPATIAARHFIRNKLEVPQPRYVVLNTLGRAVSMDVKIKLHKANRSFYKHPVRPDPRDPLTYVPIKDGKQAEIVPST